MLSYYYKFAVIFLPINLNLGFGYPKELPHRDVLLSTHNIRFLLRNKIFLIMYSGRAGLINSDYKPDN